MNANSREGTLHLDRKKIQREFEQKEYQWRQPVQSVHMTEPGRPFAGIWATAKATMLSVGHFISQLAQQGAPAGESTFRRQML